MSRSPVLAPAAGQQLAAVQAALQRAGLPFDDLTSAHLVNFLVAADPDGTITHCVGLEPFGDSGLLRSLLVAPAYQGTGAGRDLVQAMERHARNRAITHLYLLTTTAAAFFEKQGYRPCDRDDVPSAVRASNEFTTLCPSTASCMCKPLKANS